MQDNIGLAHFAPGAFDADALDQVDPLVERANASRVDDVERNAFDLDRLADLVARGAGNWRDNGHVGPGQGIEQG